MAGLRNDARLMQVSAPTQGGNSGGPLLDTSGNVVGITVSKLDAVQVTRITGDLPQNINFAIKASVAQSFLESHGVRPRTANSNAELRAADVADLAKQFTVRVECWK
jgi:S1-C subfamily serine protease